MSNSKFICKAPWVSVAFQPSGQVGPCCIFELDNLKDIGTSVESTFEQERNDFLAGNIPQGCKKCHYSFLETGKSAADSFDQYRTDFDKVHIQEINVKSNNICNLACRSCGPHFSSKWEEEFGNIITITKNKSVLDNIKLINLSHLKTVVIAGGEPTLTQEHVDVLQNLLDIGHINVAIRISTNLTSLKYKQVDLISLWKNFPNLQLQLSIDAVEDRAKNIRSGSDWEVIGKNLKTIVASKISYYVNVTVSALNIWFLEETLVHLKTNFDIDFKNISFNILFGPEQLSIQIIPSEYREDLNLMLDRCTALGYNLKQVKTYFDSTNRQDLWPNFLIYNLMLDRSRKENFFDSLPIKKHLIEQWIKL